MPQRDIGLVGTLLGGLVLYATVAGSAWPVTPQLVQVGGRTGGRAGGRAGW
jgi:hypothetical protein